MKKLLCSFSPLLICALLGCSTTGGQPGGSNGSTEALIKVAAYVGTVEGIRQHPEWEPGFRLAAEELKVLETAEKVDFALVMAIVARLPVDKLQSSRATLLITAGTIMLDQFGKQIDLSQADRMKAVVKSLREGIELGLPPPRSAATRNAKLETRNSQLKKRL